MVEWTLNSMTTQALEPTAAMIPRTLLNLKSIFWVEEGLASDHRQVALDLYCIPYHVILLVPNLMG